MAAQRDCRDCLPGTILQISPAVFLGPGQWQWQFHRGCTALLLGQRCTGHTVSLWQNVWVWCSCVLCRKRECYFTIKPAGLKDAAMCRLPSIRNKYVYWRTRLIQEQKRYLPHVQMLLVLCCRESQQEFYVWTYGRVSHALSTQRNKQSQVG